MRTYMKLKKMNPLLKFRKELKSILTEKDQEYKLDDLTGLTKKNGIPLVVDVANGLRNANPVLLSTVITETREGIDTSENS